MYRKKRGFSLVQQIDKKTGKKKTIKIPAMMGSVIGGARKKVKSGKDFAKRQVSQGRIVNNLVRGPIKPKPKPNPKPHVGKKAPTKNTSKYKTGKQTPYKKQDAHVPKSQNKNTKKPKAIGTIIKNGDGKVVKVVKDGGQFTKGKNGRIELKKNIAYKSGEHGYMYTTNSKGVVDKVVAKELKLKTPGKRKGHYQNTPDKIKGKTPKESDQAGHLIADIFGGSRHADNLVSQAYKVNNGEWKQLENVWKDAIQKGKKVSDVRIDIKYPKNSKRPAEFKVSYSIDGKKQETRKIKNTIK